MAHLSATFTKRKKKIFLSLLVTGGIAFSIVVFGELTGWQSPIIDREALRALLERARATPFALPIIIATYIASGAVLFPVTALNLLTAMVFGPLWGVLYALIGALAAAALYFGIGHALGQKHLRALMGARVQKIDSRIGEAGVIGVVLVRFLPVAPFTLVNLALGVSTVRFLDYLAGTFLALLPGAVARGLVGDSLTRIILDPSREAALYLGAGLALWAAIVYATFLVTRRLKRRKEILKR